MKKYIIASSVGVEVTYGEGNYTLELDEKEYQDFITLSEEDKYKFIEENGELELADYELDYVDKVDNYKVFPYETK